MAFSMNGKQLVSITDDSTVRIWNLESGESYLLEGHSGRVISVAFSPDGRLLADDTINSTLADSTVRIWNLESGDSCILDSHVGVGVSVAFSPNGRLLANGTVDGTVRIWNLEKFQKVGTFTIIPHLNLNGANFELAIIDEKDKELLKAAGARV